VTGDNPEIIDAEYVGPVSYPDWLASDKDKENENEAQIIYWGFGNNINRTGCRTEEKTRA
jgi:hypothetical protein